MHYCLNRRRTQCCFENEKCDTKANWYNWVKITKTTKTQNITELCDDGTDKICHSYLLEKTHVKLDDEVCQCQILTS